MPSKIPFEDITACVAKWAIPPSASFGSPVRAKGIVQELRTYLPRAVQKSLQLVEGGLEMRMPAGSEQDFARASAIIGERLPTIGQRQVLPREIEDILEIKAGERRRWLADGRLQSAGTKTVKLRGRARSITFHVFDPAHVATIRDEGLVDAWREADAERAAEKRREAAWARVRRKSDKAGRAPPSKDRDDDERPRLRGWAEFARDGLLK